MQKAAMAKRQLDITTDAVLKAEAPPPYTPKDKAQYQRDLADQKQVAKANKHAVLPSPEDNHGGPNAKSPQSLGTIPAKELSRLKEAFLQARERLLVAEKHYEKVLRWKEK